MIGTGIDSRSFSDPPKCENAPPTQPQRTFLLRPDHPGLFPSLAGMCIGTRLPSGHHSNGARAVCQPLELDDLPLARTNSICVSGLERLGFVDDSVILRTQSLQEPRGNDLALVERSVRDHPQVKVRDLIRLVESDGWYLVRTRGSHRQYKHPQKPGLVTVAGKLNDDMAAGTLNSVLKQAGLKT